MVLLQRFPTCDTTSETEGRDLTDKTLKSAKKPYKNRRGNLVGIGIEIRWLRKPLNVDGTPGRIANSVQMEMSMAKAPNKAEGG